jgi:hypothetical protein
MSDFGEAFGNAFSSAPEVFTLVFQVLPKWFTLICRLKY